MTVVGLGCHHNHELDESNKLVAEDTPGRYKSKIPNTDANKLFEQFVDSLRLAGHSIDHASFTHGGRDTP